MLQPGWLKASVPQCGDYYISIKFFLGDSDIEERIAIPSLLRVCEGQFSQLLHMFMQSRWK